MPDTLEETIDVLAELEEGLRARDGGGWRLAQSLRNAHKYSKETARQSLFPHDFFEFVAELEAQLPAACPECEGKGSHMTAATTCLFCNGSGYARETS